MNSIFKSNKVLDKDENRVERNWWRIALIVIIVCVVGGFAAGIISHFARPTTGSQTSAKTKATVKGNMKSRIYHVPGCKNYDDISPQNIEWFASEEEAENAGYRKAKNCS